MASRDYLEKVMRVEFCISADKEVRLWNRYMTGRYEPLNKMDDTLQEAGLYHGKLIVITQKNCDGTWPRVIPDKKTTVDVRHKLKDNNPNSTDPRDSSRQKFSSYDLHDKDKSLLQRHVEKETKLIQNDFVKDYRRLSRLVPLPKQSHEQAMKTKDKQTNKDLKQQRAKQQIQIHQLQEQLTNNDTTQQDQERAHAYDRDQIQQLQEQLNKERKYEQEHQRQHACNQDEIRKLQEQLKNNKRQHACDQDQIKQLQNQLNKERSKEQGHQRQHECNQMQIQQLQEQLTIKCSKEQEYVSQHECNLMQIQQIQEQLAIECSKEQDYVRQHECNQMQIQQLQEQLTIKCSKEQEYVSQHECNQMQIQQLQMKQLTIECSKEQEYVRQHECNQMQIQQLQEQLTIECSKEQEYVRQQECNQMQIQQLQKQLTIECSKEQEYQRQHEYGRDQIQQLQEQLTMANTKEQANLQSAPQQNKQHDKQQRDYAGSQSLMSDEYKEENMKSSPQNLNTGDDGTALTENDSPTTIAQRFTDLYDKEWKEAFRELKETMKIEKTVAAFLLDIVQKVYRTNFDESIRQINGVAQLITHFVQTGKAYSGQLDTQQTSAQDAYEFGSLIQYRKEVAEHAVDRLIKDFLRKYDADGQYKPTTRAFVEKCVYVTWWMCVQDPPIHMVDGKDSIVFQNEMYKSFTKTGKRIDFIVWPALQLYKDGPVLAKGVAQGK